MRYDEAWRAVVELAASRHGSFTSAEAADNGVDRRRLSRAVERGELRRPWQRVFTLTTWPSTWEQELACLTLAGGGGVASHGAAARLHGLDGFDDVAPEVTVRSGRHPAAGTTRLHRWSWLDPDDLAVVGGIPTTSLAVTVAQVGHTHPHKVGWAIDQALRRGHTIGEIDEVVQRLWRRGPTGLGLARAHLESIRTVDQPDSRFESCLLQLLRRHDVDGWATQVPVRVRGRRFRFDVAWPSEGVALECHSRRWHDGWARGRDDLERDNVLTAAGWRIVYVTWDMLDDPWSIVQLIDRARRAAA